jgi:hypothetical protein
LVGGAADLVKSTAQEVRLVTDQELRDIVASLAESQKETARMQAETDRQMKETDRQMKETDRQMKETDRKMMETDRKMKDTDGQMKETERLIQETGQQIKELGRQLGGLGDKFGSYTEGLALPSMTKILTQRFHMDVVMARVRAQRNGRSLEVDVLAYSESGVNEAYVVEVKSHLRGEAIVQMQTILREFHEFFPVHKGKKVYGILAAVDAPAGVRDKALQEGIYLARIHDGQFELQVPDDFQPRGY